MDGGEGGDFEGQPWEAMDDDSKMWIWDLVQKDEIQPENS